MNDGLRNRIDNALTVTFHADMTSAEQTDYVTAAVRAWLALPPSEDEIEMAAIVLRRQIGVGGMPDDPFEVAEKSWHETSTDEARARFRRVAKAVLVASRAVLVRPPEEP